MHDIKWIRDNPDEFDGALARRGLEPLAARVLELDTERRRSQTEAQDIQSERNRLSKEIGAAKGKGEGAEALLQKAETLKDSLGSVEEEARARGAALTEFLGEIPNLLASDVPDGADESANVEIRRHGDHPDFNFDAKPHDELGEALGQMDFERAAKISGARFVVLSGALARLERALASFMLDLHTGEYGYREISPPVLVRDAALYGTGQLPKFADDLFRAGDEYWLIPTAEVPLTNLRAGEIMDQDDLPVRLTAHTVCFRAEAGAAGKDTRGMLRQHQFNKVELVSLTHPDDAEAEHERMTACAEEVLKRLDIPYRVVLLASGDTGFSARKTYDIEAWLPGQQRYREISSCSNCGDFQARRMGARFRPKGEKGTRFVHTLNGSGLAVGRTLIALMENHQAADGTIAVPPALRPNLGGLESIGPDV